MDSEGDPAGQLPGGSSVDVCEEFTDLDIEKKWLQLSLVDAEQYRYFYDKYHTPIFNFLYWRTRDWELSGDLAGDVFLEALDRLDQFTWQGYSFGAWLFQIARKVLRRNWRRQRPDRDAEYERMRTEISAPKTPEEDVVANRDREILQECLLELSQDRQDVFVFHYWMGLTVRETALAMKIGESNAKQHLSRGRRQILKMIQSRGLAEEMSDAGQMVVRELEFEGSDMRVVSDKDQVGEE